MIQLNLRFTFLAVALVTALSPKPGVCRSVEITESFVNEVAKKEHISSIKAELERVDAEIKYLSSREAYQTNLSVNTTRMNSTIPALNSFQPVFGPLDKANIDISRHLGGGVSARAGVYSEKYNSIDGSIVDQTYAGAKVGLEIDLWKNIFGKLESANLERAEFQAKKSKLKSEVDISMAQYGARKIYWSLVANELKKDAIKSLIKQVEKQKKISVDKHAAGVGEKSDIYRYDAQVSNSKAILTGLNYQYESLIIQLKKLLPTLNGRTISVGKVYLDNKISEVVSCTNTILSRKTTPWDFTLYDEILSLAAKQHQSSLVLNKRHSYSDLKLSYEHKQAALGEDYSGAEEQFSENPEQEFAVNLKWTVPLSSEPNATSKKMVRASRLAYKLEVDSLKSLVESRHDQMANLISLLQTAVAQRVATGKSLENTLKESKKLYGQARIPIDVLISDQTQYYNAQIDTYSAQLLVIHELLDYFSIFSQTPCKLNTL